jgi:outer membrane protein assembly factor BamB
MSLKKIFAGLVIVFAGGVCGAGDWPQWRGPTGIGVTDEKELPLKWDGKNGENIAWKASLKGTTGHSSPIVFGDRVFVTTSDIQTREQEKEIPDHHVACFKVADGSPMWNTLIPHGKELAGYSIYASPTPATDGKAVYAWFGSAVIAAVDMEGKLLWRHERTGPFLLNPGICASPILYGETVILLCDQGRGQGFVQGLDKKTGEVKWEKKREGTGTCNTTPIVIEVAGKKQLIVSAENKLQGLDPASGEAIWWCKGWGFGASPVFGNGLVYADKGGNEPAQAVDPTGKGDVTATHVKWKIEKSPGDYSSPVISGDFVYRVQSEGVIGCTRLSTGEKVFTGRLEHVSKLSSPVATTDGRVYLVSTGDSYVIKAGPSLEILAASHMEGGGNGASPAFANGKIFTRDFDWLYCIGGK